MANSPEIFQKYVTLIQTKKTISAIALAVFEKISKKKHMGGGHSDLPLWEIWLIVYQKPFRLHWSRVPMDLSKTYDCLPKHLIITKLEAYGFDSISFKLFHSYFSNWRQTVKIGSAINEKEIF